MVLALGVDVPDNFDDRRSRASLDKRMREWSSTLDARWLEEQLTDTSKVDGVTRTVSWRVLVVHMLNHQTHHRGQVTTTLSQMDLDIGTTDIPFMPQFQV